MTQRMSGHEGTVWLGRESEGREAFGGGRLWIGQHSGDRDILVFDPAETDASSEVLHLYSLTQHRTRSFPRATVHQRIHVLGDEITHARAKKEYAQRAKRRATHEEGLAEARTERMDRRRDGVIAAHRLYLEARGLACEGVRDTAPDHRPGRRTKCHRCQIALDDFAGTVCAACSGVLCSCGACACGKP